jgi:hypothetical protein
METSVNLLAVGQCLIFPKKSKPYMVQGSVHFCRGQWNYGTVVFLPSPVMETRHDHAPLVANSVGTFLPG